MTFFDIVHYTLVGFGVCFTILLIILAFQGLTKIILLAYGNKEPSTEVHTHTHSEEHHVHHVHHAQYEDEVVPPVQAARTIRRPGEEYQRIVQTIEPSRAITRVRRS